MASESDVVEVDLAGDFAPASREAWRQLVAGVLARSGVTGDPEQALASTTYDGFDLQPLYTAADRPADFVWPIAASSPGWDIRQHHAGTDPARVNEAILRDLENGVTSIWLTLGPGGLAVGDLARALEGVLLDLAPISLDAGPDGGAAARALLALAGDSGLTGSLGLDPLGLYARTSAPPDFAELLDGAESVRGRPGLTAITIDGPTYHDAGASDAEELAIATSVGVAYARALTDAGWDVGDAFATIGFRFAVTGDQFASISKLRAGRRIWARIAELCGVPETDQRQHAVTSRAMLTQRDPWVNMLRATVACFGAVVGGADAVTVASFDAAIGEPDDFGRRIARNTQSILQDESNLGRVIDPAGGSWYVEARTEQVAQSAWDQFTVIEARGGALASLHDGYIRGLVAATNSRRFDAIAHRRDPITGVSEFAMIDEEPVIRAPYPESTPTELIAPLWRHRWAEPFEQLRDEADARPVRPVVFLAALGAPATYSGRAGYARNLFNAGGIGSVLGDGSTDEIVAAFAAAATPIACLCSSDRVYAEQGDEVEAALLAAGASTVWRAGREFAAGSDAVAALRNILDGLA